MCNKQTCKKYMNKRDMRHTCIIVEIKLGQRVYFLFGFFRAWLGVVSLLPSGVLGSLLSCPIRYPLLVLWRAAAGKINTCCACRWVIRWPTNSNRNRSHHYTWTKENCSHCWFVEFSLQRDDSGIKDPNSKSNKPLWLLLSATSLKRSFPKTD